MNKRKEVPVWEKTTLSINEAAAYSGISSNRLRVMTNEPDCDYILWVGSRKLIKRNRFEKFIDNAFFSVRNNR